ncbi:Hypothetical predicted protein [Mytilus galloprovincialis]|nr:Hypothetical predicted protein [Mytilus galloprovincialis]
MHRNRLLSSSDYCQIKDTEDPYQGQISWTNVFREEVEIIRTQVTMGIGYTSSDEENKWETVKGLQDPDTVPLIQCDN